MHVSVIHIHVQCSIAELKCALAEMILPKFRIDS